MQVMTNADFESAWLESSCKPVEVASFNGYRLLGVFENGLKRFQIFRHCDNHGPLPASQEFTVKFVQQARQRFFTLVGHAEK
jgi:hypothetical protein